MMEENFANRYFAALYGGLTILISVNLLVIQKTAERCNKDYLKQYRKKNILPTQRIMFYDIPIKFAGTLISVFLRAPAIIIAVFIALEYNSLATRITQKRHMRAVAAESARLENAALASLGAMDVPQNEPNPEDDRKTDFNLKRRTDMKEIILCKYGEIILKGANRPEFEGALTRELKRRLAPFGRFKIRRAESTVYITPEDDICDLDGAYGTARLVFGFVGVTRAAECEKSMESILETARAYLPPLMSSARTFRVDAKRSDKLFPKTSPEIAAEVGGAILSAAPRLKVDLHHPDAMIRVEIRDRAAYVHAGQEKGAGGLPRGTSGRGLLLLSGGIDSPVAGYMMAKRGVEIEALHFESFPYTSERAREKVFTLAEELCRYCSRIHIHVISLTGIQEELRRACDEEFFTLMLRRFMMKLAERCADQFGCRALVTGESLGQVASQTMDALAVTNAATSLPVLRPLIGMDKEEIVEISRKIGTFDTSILPYEDCCTVFTPRHPKTKPTEDEILREVEKIDFDALLDDAYATLYTETRRVEGYDF